MGTPRATTRAATLTAKVKASSVDRGVVEEQIVQFD